MKAISLVLKVSSVTTEALDVILEMGVTAPWKIRVAP